MPTRKTPSGRKRQRKGIAALLPDEPQVPAAVALPYEGLQQRYDPTAEARAALLVEQGYGALRDWLEEQPPEMEMAELVRACLRGSISGHDAAELWRRQQRQQQGIRGRRRAVDQIDWGDAVDQAA